VYASKLELKRIFEHCLDSLYSDIVQDISVDIEVLEQLMNLEGLNK